MRGRTPRYLDPEFTQRTKHHGLYPLVFSEEILQRATSIIDFGAGDNDYHAIAPSNQRVVRVDAQYVQRPPVGDDWIAADFRKPIPGVDDSEFDISLASFVMQHAANPEDRYAILREMLRVTKIRSDDKAKRSGMLMIFPVFRRDKLTELMQAYPGVFECGFFDLHSLEDYEDGYYSAWPTLVVHKTPTTAPELDAALFELARCGALEPKVARRALGNIGKYLTRLGLRDSTRRY